MRCAQLAIKPDPHLNLPSRLFPSSLVNLLLYNRNSNLLRRRPRPFSRTPSSPRTIHLLSSLPSPLTFKASCPLITLPPSSPFLLQQWPTSIQRTRPSSSRGRIHIPSPLLRSPISTRPRSSPPSPSHPTSTPTVTTTSLNLPLHPPPSKSLQRLQNPMASSSPRSLRLPSSQSSTRQSFFFAFVNPSSDVLAQSLGTTRKSSYDSMGSCWGAYYC